MDAFRYLLRVRYAECDAQKVVFNARYGEYVDLASTEFFRALGYGEQVISGELDYQLVKQTLEWRAPARFDEVLELSVRARHLGNTSFTLHTEFRIHGHSAVTAEAETVYVRIDPHSHKKLPLDEALRSALERGTDLVCNHAGLP